MINIYTDGACSGNPGRGGWGAVIIHGPKKYVLHGFDLATTNNRMEITAVIRGLESVKNNNEIKIFSDSMYVINTMTKGWKRNKNQDLWELLDQEVLKRKVTWQWVKGHGGDVLNEEADRLAFNEAQGKFKEVLIMDDGPDQNIEETLNELSHIDENGKAKMVDIGEKFATNRVAVAKSTITMIPEVLDKINSHGFEKGDVLSIARVAGIMGAKQTSNLIPLCHQLSLTQILINFHIDKKNSNILIEAVAKTFGKTGVEMEALTAASIATLTIYDMCKSADKSMKINTWLSRKSGGRSGDLILD